MEYKRIDINDCETLIIKGDIDNYSFELMIYSEAFNYWVLQDLSALENLRLEAYNKLVERVENLLRKAA